MGRPAAAARPVTAAEINAQQNRTNPYAAGLEDLHPTTGPLTVISPMGFWRDEGAHATARFVGRAVSRPGCVRKLARLMPRMLRAISYLGYVMVGGARV
jgi:hypothetical protein